MRTPKGEFARFTTFYLFIMIAQPNNPAKTHQQNTAKLFFVDKLFHLEIIYQRLLSF